MKKIFALILALALVLSMSVAAYAAPSPTKIPTTEDLPGTTDAVIPAPATAEIIPNDKLTEEQKAVVDEALAEVTKKGYLPEESFYVEANGDAVIVITLEEGEVVLVIDKDGNVVEYSAEDLTALGNDKYELSVSGSCVVVIAKKA